MSNPKPWEPGWVPPDLPPSADNIPRSGDGKFLPGVSGNPKGRKAGIPNKKSPLEARIAAHGEALVDKLLEAALEKGDLVALGLALQRVSPALRSRSEKVTFELDPDLPVADQAQQIMSAVAAGDVDPQTGKMLIDCLSSVAGLRQVDELASRIAALEGKAGQAHRMPIGAIVELQQ